MRAFELFPHRHVQRFGRDAGRLAGVGMTIIALVIGECTPITATVRRPRTATPYMVAGLPLPITATASLGRLAAEAIGQWPLRFEVCDKGGPGRFLARTSNSNIHLTATEATLVWQTAAGAGRLGCGADLGLPRNAGSLDANEQLPGPRRDRAAPRPRRSATDESLTASVRMQLIGANPRAVMAGEGAPSTPTHYFIGDDPKRWRTNVPGYLRVKAENVYRGVDVIYYGKGRQFEYDFKVAPHAVPAQNLDVAVINPDGQSNALVQALTYNLPPAIGGVAVSGKDLIVSGLFDAGATILLNGERQNTIARIENQQLLLIGKKLGKRIKPGQTAQLQVQNSDGLTSPTFFFTRPPQ